MNAWLLNYWEYGPKLTYNMWQRLSMELKMTLSSKVDISIECEDGSMSI